MQKPNIFRLKSVEQCDTCKIKSKDIFQLEEKNKSKKCICSICLSIQYPYLFKNEMKVGLLLKRKSNYRIYSLLFRAIAHAKHSNNEEYIEKAKRVEKSLLSTTDIVLEEFGSDNIYDIEHVLKEYHQLLPMNFGDDFTKSVSNSEEEFLPVENWKDLI